MITIPSFVNEDCASYNVGVEKKDLDRCSKACKIRILRDAGVAQLVERNLAKVEVASSRLVSRSRIQERGKHGLPLFSCIVQESRNDGIGRRSGLKIRRL